MPAPAPRRVAAHHAVRRRLGRGSAAEPGRLAPRSSYADRLPCPPRAEVPDRAAESSPDRVNGVLGVAADARAGRRRAWAAKTVLLPLALGVILAFTLTPLVRLFDRWRLPRFAGVALTMLLALGAVGGIGYVVFDQFADLSTQVTKYTSSMRRKVAELRIGNDAAFRQLTRTVDRVTEQLDENVCRPAARAAGARRAAAPTPVERLREARGCDLRTHCERGDRHRAGRVHAGSARGPARSLHPPDRPGQREH